MSSRLIYKTSITLFVLFTSSMSIAKTDDQIRCPLPTTVHQGALVLDDYMTSVLYENTYFVSSDSPAFYESNMPWYVNADGVISESSDKASILKAGRDAINKATRSMWEPAFKTSNNKYYICKYEPGDITVTGIIQK